MSILTPSLESQCPAFQNPNVRNMRVLSHCNCRLIERDLKQVEKMHVPVLRPTDGCGRSCWLRTAAFL